MSEPQGAASRPRRRYVLNWQDVISADGQDSLSRSPLTKLVVYGGIAAYMGLVLWRSSRTDARTSDVSEAGANFDYASPEGLKMVLTTPFTHFALNLHYYCAVALVPVAMLQKFFIQRMKALTPEERQARTEAERKEFDESRHNYQQNIHTMFGNITLALMGGMAYGGYSMRHDSNFAHFSTAMIGFAAPWVVFFVGIMFTARWRWRHAHAFFGNLVVKACISVPLARVLGVALQDLNTSRMDLLNSLPSGVGSWLNMWSEEEHHLAPSALPSAGSLPHDAMLGKGYYVGIATAAVIIGVWSSYDALMMWRRLGVVQREKEGQLNRE